MILSIILGPYRNSKNPLWKKVCVNEKNLKNWIRKHEARYNRTAKTGLDFRSPDQVVAEYFSKYSKCNIYLDN